MEMAKPKSDVTNIPSLKEKKGTTKHVSVLRIINFSKYILRK